MSAFSGSIQAKKKAELQEIATALHLSDAGTRDELQQRIKKHLDEYHAELEDDPTFSGLLTSRKRQRSLQPSAPPSSGHSHSNTARVVIASSRQTLTQIKETDYEHDSSPTAHDYDVHDVSMMLPTSNATPTRAGPSAAQTSPSSLPPLPPSPAKSILADALAAPEVQAVVEMERSFTRGARSTLLQTRALLSNGSTLFVLTSLFDTVRLLTAIHHEGAFPLPPLADAPAVSLFATVLALAHWALPALILPAIAGYLVSFTYTASSSPGSTTGSLSFDPLTASIARVAGTLAYGIPYIRITTTPDTLLVQHVLDARSGGADLYSLDVLGTRWRLFTATLSLAFAVAEGLGRAASSSNGQGRAQLVSTRGATPAASSTRHGSPAS